MADIQNFAITRLTTVSATIPNFSIRYLFSDVHNSSRQLGNSFTGQDVAFFAQFTDAELEAAYRDMIFKLIQSKAALL